MASYGLRRAVLVRAPLRCGVVPQAAAGFRDGRSRSVQHRVGQDSEQWRARRQPSCAKLPARQRQRRSSSFDSSLSSKAGWRTGAGSGRRSSKSAPNSVAASSASGAVSMHHHRVHAARRPAVRLGAAAGTARSGAGPRSWPQYQLHTVDLGDGEGDRARGGPQRRSAAGSGSMLVPEDWTEAQVRSSDGPRSGRSRLLVVLVPGGPGSGGLCLGLSMFRWRKVKLGHGRRGRWRSSAVVEPIDRNRVWQRSLQEARALTNLLYPRSGRRLIRAGSPDVLDQHPRRTGRRRVAGTARACSAAGR